MRDDTGGAPFRASGGRHCDPTHSGALQTAIFRFCEVKKFAARPNAGARQEPEQLDGAPSFFEDPVGAAEKAPDAHRPPTGWVGFVRLLCYTYALFSAADYGIDLNGPDPFPLHYRRGISLTLTRMGAERRAMDAALWSLGLLGMLEIVLLSP